jgi:hypothetical protein
MDSITHFTLELKSIALVLTVHKIIVVLLQLPDTASQFCFLSPLHHSDSQFIA